MRRSSSLVSPISSRKPPYFLSYCLEGATLRFSLKMALVIGTILAIINHGTALFTGHMTSGELWSIALTYCVPFAVAMYSQVQGKLQRDLARTLSEVQSEVAIHNKQEERDVL